MNIMKKNFSLTGLSIILLLFFGLWSCTDMDVVNVNDPDEERALQEPGDVSGLISGSFLTWWQGTHVAGWGLTIQTIADAYSMSWGNFGMRDNSSEPRIAWNNSPAYADASTLEYPWYRWYKAISAASDGLKAIQGGINMGDPDANGNYLDNKRAEAFVKFVQGISHGNLGIFFDQAFIVDETTVIDPTVALTLSNYSDVIAAAVAYLEDCIAICKANSFTIPYEWLHIVGFDENKLAKLCHSFIARLLASEARDRTGRVNADWATIVYHIDQGIEEQFAPVGDAENWWARHMYYSGVSASWGRGDYKTIGPADTSGAYQAWLAKDVASRVPFVVETIDKRITGGLDTLDKQLPGLYFKNEYKTRLIAGRGTYHQSFYWAYKQNVYASDLLGPMPDMPMSEMYLLKAEAALHSSDLATAAEYINKTRVDIGELNPAIAGTKGSIDDPPDARDGASLWAMLKYEKIIEGLLTHPYVPYADRRGYGDMVTGTPLHYPIPGKELEVLLMESYTFGGKGGPGAAPKIVGNLQSIWERFNPYMSTY